MNAPLRWNALMTAVLMLSVACEGKKEKKGDAAPAATQADQNAKATNTGTNTKTATDKATETGSSVDGDAAAAKKLEGKFKIDVAGQFLGKAFVKNGLIYEFKAGAKDFPILPDNIKTMSGVSSVNYDVSENTMNVYLNREKGKITLVMAINWTDDDTFTAEKKSCTNSGTDTLGTLVCQQLTKLDINGERQASATSP